jgi:hypothetical protein
MTSPLLFSILESPGHPNFSALYRQLGIEERRLPSQRKAVHGLIHHYRHSELAVFLYGIGDNDAGANLSNLDVFLASLQKFAPAARVILLVDKSQRPYVDKLAARFSLHATLEQPVALEAMAAVLGA